MLVVIVMGFFMHAIDIQGLNKVYDNGVVALSDVDLRVSQGEILGLLGPNGAGKTTLIGIINTLVQKTSGQVEVLGHSLDSDPSALKACVGTVPQEYNFSIFEQVFDIVKWQAGYFGLPRRVAKERATHYLKQLQLWDKKDLPARTLSGGMKRRLMTARAMVHEPKVLILDEPTAGVDIEIRRSMWKYLLRLKQEGTTVILTTHYLEEAEFLCDRIAIINQGKIIKDAPKDELISELSFQSFIFDVQGAQELPLSDNEFTMTKLSSSRFRVDLTAGQSLNHVLDFFSKNGVIVTSMRNKANRLEELFLNLTRRDGGAQ